MVFRIAVQVRKVDQFECVRAYRGAKVHKETCSGVDDMTVKYCRFKLENVNLTVFLSGLVEAGRRKVVKEIEVLLN